MKRKFTKYPVTSASRNTIDSCKNRLYIKIKDAVRQMMISPSFGFEEDEVDEYSAVNVTVGDDALKIEVGAEVSFDGLMKLAEALDPIVQEYDSEAYFDAEDSGRLVSFVRVSKIEGADAIMSRDEYWLDPPEYDEPKYKEHIEELEIDIDTDIIIYDENGYWDYVDEKCEWARQGDMNNGEEFSSLEYGRDLVVASLDYVVESIYDLLTPLLPMDVGTYHISGTADLFFNISDIEYETSYHGPDREDENGYEETEYYFDDAESEFMFDKSRIYNFKYEKISDNIQSDTEIEASPVSVKFDSHDLTDGSVTARYEGVKYSVHCNTVDTNDAYEAFRHFQGDVQEVHPYDEGKYFWAKFGNGKISYYSNEGKCVDTSYYMSADDWDMGVSEWFESVLTQIIQNLREMNKDVESIMVHN